MAFLSCKLRPAAAAAAHGILLLLLVTLFCTVTQWGRSYPTFARRSWLALRTALPVPREERILNLYDETYPVLLYMQEFLPPDAVVLLPPTQFVRDHVGGIPLLASPTGTYNIIYPRIPVHAGDDSPALDRVTHLLVWDHWGLDQVAPGEEPNRDNRVGLYPLTSEGTAP